MTIEQLFFELIRVAIGTQVTLSRPPSKVEWSMLYDIAKKQSLFGICFAGVQNLTINHPSSIIHLSELLRLQWMGMAAKIQQCNEVVNRQCVDLGERLKVKGYRYTILKGQGIEALYSEHLRGLRQSGDIDVWVKEPFEKVMAYVQQVAPTNEVSRLHVSLHVYENTEVELHFTPVKLKYPWRDRKLQQWFDAFDIARFEEVNGYVVAPLEMNVVFILLHIYKHLFNEGIGLRQVMDYYFVLVAYAKRELPQMNPECDINTLFDKFGLAKFAAAMMWIMREVFGMSEQLMLCEPNEKLGKMILADIMQRGNFGHGDERRDMNEGVVKRFVRTTSMSMKYLPYFPAEVLWQPWYRFTQRAWMLRHGYK